MHQEYGDELFLKWEKVLRLAKEGSTPGERQAAQNVLDGMRQKYPHLADGFEAWKSRKVNTSTPFSQAAQDEARIFIEKLLAAVGNHATIWGQMTFGKLSKVAEEELRMGMEEAGKQLDALLDEQLKKIRPSEWRKAAMATKERAVEKEEEEEEEEENLSRGTVNWTRPENWQAYPVIVSDPEFLEDLESPEVGTLIQVTIVIPLGLLETGLSDRKTASAICQTLATEIEGFEDDENEDSGEEE